MPTSAEIIGDMDQPLEFGGGDGVEKVTAEPADHAPAEATPGAGAGGIEPQDWDVVDEIQIMPVDLVAESTTCAAGIQGTMRSHAGISSELV